MQLFSISGCFLNDSYYPDGAMLPPDPKKPCEVCYCIRNSTSCVVQECELKIEGCSPMYKPGQCCPCRYNCCKYQFQMLGVHNVP